jgi:hypothetical protein
MSAMSIDPNLFATARPPGLGRNPTLPQHPLGAYTDSTYEAAQAELAHQTQQQYNDILKQLGYTDENGNFVMGDVETEAARQHASLGRDEDLARRDVTNQMQQQGTLFSGYRGLQQARMTEPMETGRAQLLLDTPKTLADLYGKAAGVLSDYTIQQNKLIADAATRRSAQLATDPGGGAAVTAPDPTVVQSDAGLGTGPMAPDVFAPLANADPNALLGTAVGHPGIAPDDRVGGAAPTLPTPPLPNQGYYIAGGQQIAGNQSITPTAPRPTAVNPQAVASAAARATRRQYYGS